LRKQPYSVPEGYFDTFKSQMRPYEKQQVTLAARLVPYVSIAAVFVFLVTVGTLFLKKSTPYDDLTQEDFLVFSTTMANTEYYEMDQIADAGLADEDIIEYLIYCGISAEEIELSK
jgi:hypothetical protein